MDQNWKFAYVPFESKLKLLTDFQNTVLALLENCLPSKLIQDIYLHKVLHLTKSGGVKMSLKISFFDPISIIFKYCNKNCRISDTSSCMWTLVKSPNKIENFREFWGQKITQKQPKMSFDRYMNIHLKVKNSRTTDSILLKLVHYVYHFNPFHLLKTECVNQRKRTPQKTITKCDEFLKSGL